jgi:hypothetical protein
MKLRSGTILDIQETHNDLFKFKSLLNTREDSFERNLNKRIDDQKNHPVSLDINNIIYALRVYESLDIYLDSICNISNSLHNRFVIVAFQKCVQTLSELIQKTYRVESIKYSDYTKGLIVKTLYKVDDMLTRVGYMLRDLEYDSDYISDLLQISIDKKGEEILDKDSFEARVYYCYRYFYKWQDADKYNIFTYADGHYSEVEIYDYYFKENASKDEQDDLLLKNGYVKWFVCAETTDRYDIVAYDKLDTTKDTYSFTMLELEELRDFHKNESDKYSNIISKKTHQRMKMMNW